MRLGQKHSDDSRSKMRENRTRKKQPTSVVRLEQRLIAELLHKKPDDWTLSDYIWLLMDERQ